MAGYSSRQSTFTTGDTITAAHSNNEFNAVLAAFHVSTGHKHDGSTAGDGGPISTLFSNAISMGTNANTDVAVTFNANSNDGVITWMEDQDYFQFSDDILISTTEKILFRDTAIYINSSADGQLDIVADTEIQIAATTIDMNGNVDVSGTLVFGSLGDGTVTITDIADEDNMSSNSATKLATQQSIKAYVDATVTAEDLDVTSDSGTIAIDLDSETLTIAGGTGLASSAAANTVTLAVDAAQTGITSLLAADIKIGEDNETKIDFEDVNEIHFYAANAEQVYVADGIFGPQTDSDVDLGTTGVRWKDAFIDTVTTTGNVTVGGDLTISGDDLIMGTNTSGHILVADGTNFNPTAVTDLGEISSVASGDVLLAVDASGGGLKKITRSTLVSGLATSSGIANMAEDTTPQLGGDLDAQGNSITDVGILGSSYGPTGTPTVVTVTVASKTAAHPYYGDGSSSGYFLDGAESPAIDLHGADSVTSSSGYYYKFDQAHSSNGGHPLRFYLDAAKTIAYTTGVTTSGTPGTAGAHTTIAVTDQTPSTLYYQCSAHAYMGNYAGLNSAYIASSSAVTIDAVGDIILDADGGDIFFKDAGTTFGSATNSSGNLLIKSGTTTALTFTGANVAVAGNLTVNGSTTTVNSTTVTIDDPIFTLGGDSTPSSDDNKDRGIEFKYHTGSAAKVGFFGWDDSAGAFTFVPDATNSSEVFSGTAGNVVFANIAGTLTTASQTNITGVGALDAGSITANFGTINTGSSNITTSGTVSGGTLAGTLSTAAQGNVTSLGTLSALTVDNVIINGTTIGHTDDTDLMTLSNGGLVVAGTLEATGNITGTLATAAQTNITSLGTLSALTVDNIAINGTTIGHTDDTDLMTLASGGLTVAGTVQGTTITATTAVVPDTSGGADLGSTSLEWGDLYIADDKKISLGSDQNFSIEYDENGNDTTAVVAAGGVSLAPHGTGTGNGTELRFQELAANGANYVGFKSPDAIAANKVFVLPNADGSAGQLLTTDGSTNLSWSTVAASPTVTKTVKSGKELADGDPVVINSAGTVETPLNARTGGTLTAVAVGGTSQFNNKGLGRRSLVKGSRAGTAGGIVMIRPSYSGEAISSYESLYAQSLSVNSSNVITAHTKSLITGTDRLQWNDNGAMFTTAYDPDTDRFITFYIGGTGGSSGTSTSDKNIRSVMYTQGSSGQYTMTVHTKETITSTLHSDYQNSVDCLTAGYDTVNNRILLMYRLRDSDNTSSYPQHQYYLIAGTVTGGTTNTISWGSPLDVTYDVGHVSVNGHAAIGGSMAIDPDNGGCVCVFGKSASSSGGTERIWVRAFSFSNVSNNTLTRGSAVDVVGGVSSYYHKQGQDIIYDTNTNRFIIQYKRRQAESLTSTASTYSQGYLQCRFQVISRSGNSLTAGNAIDSSNYTNVINNGEAFSDGETNIGHTSAGYNTLVQVDIPTMTLDTSTNKLIVVYGDAKDGNDDIEGKQYAEAGTIVGGTTNTVTFDYDNRVLVHDTQDNDGGYNSYGTPGRYSYKQSLYEPDTDCVVLTFIEDIYQNERFRAQALVTTRASTLTSGGFIGFSDGAYSSGTTATVQLSGAIDDAQSSLTTGSPYYLQESDMSLATTPSPFFAGTALSSTTLLVKGQTNKANVTDKVFCGSYDFRVDGSSTAQNVLISLPSGYTAANVRAYEINYYGIGFASDGNFLCMLPYNGSSSVYNTSYNTFVKIETNSGNPSNNSKTQSTAFIINWNSNTYDMYSANDVDNPKQTYDNTSGHGGQLTGDGVYTNSLKNGSFHNVASWRYGSGNNHHAKGIYTHSASSTNSTTNYADGFYFYAGNDSQNPQNVAIMEGVISIYAIIG